MADLKLFSYASNKTLVAGQSSSQPIDPRSLPLFCGDTLALSLYFLQTPVGYNPQDVQNNTLETIPTTGLTPFVVINDGTVAGTTYAQAAGWAADASLEFFAGTMSLNGVALVALVTAAGTAGVTLWLKIGYIQGGVPTTTFSAQVFIGVGVPIGAPVPVPGLTALSAEVANATYYPQQPVPGLILYVTSPLGKQLALQAVDQPDGTAILQASPVN